MIEQQAFCALQLNTRRINCSRNKVGFPTITLFQRSLQPTMEDRIAMREKIQYSPMNSCQSCARREETGKDWQVPRLKTRMKTTLWFKAWSAAPVSFSDPHFKIIDSKWATLLDLHFYFHCAKNYISDFQSLSPCLGSGPQIHVLLPRRTHRLALIIMIMGNIHHNSYTGKEAHVDAAPNTVRTFQEGGGSGR